MVGPALVLVNVARAVLPHILRFGGKAAADAGGAVPEQLARKSGKELLDTLFEMPGGEMLQKLHRLGGRMLNAEDALEAAGRIGKTVLKAGPETLQKLTQLGASELKERLGKEALVESLTEFLKQGMQRLGPEFLQMVGGLLIERLGSEKAAKVLGALARNGLNALGEEVLVEMGDVLDDFFGFAVAGDYSAAAAAPHMPEDIG